ncbi:hypothetical protein K501DRAFT_270450 [Backusella circina FSU 941]|nr:hypothetical protein K501DRAFT_270450 [Backusella circina FSU 941]
MESTQTPIFETFEQVNILFDTTPPVNKEESVPSFEESAEASFCWRIFYEIAFHEFLLGQYLPDELLCPQDLDKKFCFFFLFFEVSDICWERVQLMLSGVATCLRDVPGSLAVWAGLSQSTGRFSLARLIAHMGWLYSSFVDLDRVCGSENESKQSKAKQFSRIRW